MKNYRWVATCGVLIFIGLLSGVPRNTTSGQSGTPPYKDSSLAIEKRVDDLVSRMTLAEKVSQMMNAAPAIEHLNIPEYEWWNEGLHGVARAGYATVFPQAIGLAATWDTDLMNQVADVISTEARAKHHDLYGTMNTDAIKVLPSGVRTLTSFATRAGGEGKKLMVK